MSELVVFRGWATREDALAELSPTLAPDALSTLDRALTCAERWHGPQRRPTGTPYLEHLLEALDVLVRGAGVTDPDVVAATVLHDVVEDTSATLDEVRREFGPRVAELVEWVTKPAAVGASDKAAVTAAYLRRLRDAPRDAVRVKLADRASNVQRLYQMPPSFQRRYFAETVEHILPLAGREPWFADWYATWQQRFVHLA